MVTECGNLGGYGYNLAFRVFAVLRGGGVANKNLTKLRLSRLYMCVCVFVAGDTKYITHTPRGPNKSKSNCQLLR